MTGIKDYITNMRNKLKKKGDFMLDAPPRITPESKPELFNNGKLIEDEDKINQKSNI